MLKSNMLYEFPACKAAVILIMFVAMPSIDYHNNTHYQLVQLLSFNGYVRQYGLSSL